MVEYSKVIAKLSDAQVKKLKTAVKKKTETSLRMGFKMVDGNYLPHELLLTTRRKTKLRNAFSNNMSTDLTLSMLKCFSSIRNNSSWFSNWCRNSKENTRFSDNNFDNFKQRNEWQWKSFRLLKILIFCWKESLKQLKTKEKSR